MAVLYAFEAADRNINGIDFIQRLSVLEVDDYRARHLRFHRRNQACSAL